jgi:hypothetical protein
MQLYYHRLAQKHEANALGNHAVMIYCAHDEPLARSLDPLTEVDGYPIGVVVMTVARAIQ